MKFQDWQRLLVPELTIDAITIEDRLVQVFGFNKRKKVIDKIGSYPLSAGIIEGGILKRPLVLQSFLTSLRHKLWPRQKKVWLILSLPSANFYTNILSIPELEQDKFKEAVTFNAQINTPIPLNESYFDWEDWGPSSKDGEREVFIALGVKKQIDDYLNVLAKSEFQVVAVEPFALSLTRFLAQFSQSNKGTLVINIRQEGMEFIITEGRKLIFFDFDSWQEIFGPKIPQRITLPVLKQHLAEEIPMLVNFYLLKKNKKLEQFFLGGSQQQIVDALSREVEEQYELSPLVLHLPPYLQELPSSWYGVVGAALRGLIPRRRDTIVSLAPVGTEQDYYQHHLYNIVSLWGKALITVMAALVLITGVLNNSFFSHILANYRRATKIPVQAAISQKDKQLTQQVKEFNKLVVQAATLKKYNQNWYTVLPILFKEAQTNSVNIKRILISASPAKNITLLGGASQKQSVVAFKKALSQNKIFAQVTLPLETLVVTPSGVTFSLNIKIK